MQRAKLLSGLKVIDYVIINNKATSENIINLIKPDYYIKGKDYKNNKKDITQNIIKEVNAVQKIGGKNQIYKFKKDDSSKILDTFDLIFTDEQKNNY